MSNILDLTADIVCAHAPEYAERRRQATLDRGLGEKLVAAKAVRKKAASEQPAEKKTKK